MESDLWLAFAPRFVYDYIVRVSVSWERRPSRMCRAAHQHNIRGHVNIMDIQISDLVSSIRKEGIEAANAQAEAILAEARGKAEAMLADAAEKAKGVKDAAEKEAAHIISGARADADQARRDAMLAFKAQVKQEFEKLLRADVKKAMDPQALVTLISAALAGEDPSRYTAEIAEADAALASEMAEKIRGGLTICPTRHVQAGFRLGAKDGSGYFDCSDDAVMKMLMPYFRTVS